MKKTILFPLLFTFFSCINDNDLKDKVFNNEKAAESSKEDTSEKKEDPSEKNENTNEQKHQSNQNDVCNDAVESPNSYKYIMSNRWEVGG